MNKEKSINFDKDYRCMRFNKELYSKTALIKAAYNYLENAYIHLDMDEKYYYVFLKEKKEDIEIKEDDFMNEDMKCIYRLKILENYYMLVR